MHNRYVLLCTEVSNLLCQREMWLPESLPKPQLSSLLYHKVLCRCVEDIAQPCSAFLSILHPLTDECCSGIVESRVATRMEFATWANWENDHQVLFRVRKHVAKSPNSLDGKLYFFSVLLLLIQQLQYSTHSKIGPLPMFAFCKYVPTCHECPGAWCDLVCLLDGGRKLGTGQEKAFSRGGEGKEKGVRRHWWQHAEQAWEGWHNPSVRGPWT